jgi:hypothetical protein
LVDKLAIRGYMRDLNVLEWMSREFSSWYVVFQFTGLCLF